MSDPRGWGVSEAEGRAAYPCDALPFARDETFYRGIGVAAPPALVFRWLCQLRAAPYSYDWLDNFGRPSPSRLTDGLERLDVGQRIMLIFRLVAFQYGKSMTLELGSRVAAAAMGDFAGSYLVVPNGDGTRLLAKILVRYPRGLYGTWLRRVMPHGDLFMFKEQLRRLKRYAERDAALERKLT
ncbi:MAG: hypothetical protein IAI49_02680 [Candidatus Eremiobacteraeota bacterium]|nr:hypothetical protein [Candidatus Eremiobacteraeota bacterium]